MRSVLSTAFLSLQTYQEFEEAGTDLAQALNKKEKVLKQRGMDADVAKALGKLSSGLYVVMAEHTGVQGGARSAMIASWVAQASFEPLGLTIAVAKDRAIESLMQVRQPTFLDFFGKHVLLLFVVLLCIRGFCVMAGVASWLQHYFVSYYCIRSHIHHQRIADKFRSYFV